MEYLVGCQLAGRETRDHLRWRQERKRRGKGKLLSSPHRLTGWREQPSRTKQLQPRSMPGNRTARQGGRDRPSPSGTITRAAREQLKSSQKPLTICAKYLRF